MGFSKNKQASQNTSQQTSTSSNAALPFLQGALGGEVSRTSQGNNAIADLLGLNGSASQNAGFEQFRNSSSYNFLKEEGMRGINSNNAARGLLNSGSALRGISRFNNDLAGNFLDKYFEKLSGLSNSGLGSAQVISGAGNTSQSQGTSSGNSSGGSKSFQFG